ncbi:MAG: hypothetical protein AB1403_16630 [Candidatus Riflebacteria bacterium]
MPKNIRKQKFEKDETDFPGTNKQNRLDQEEPEKNTETPPKKQYGPQYWDLMDDHWFEMGIPEPEFYESRFGGKTRKLSEATDEEKALALARSFERTARAIQKHRENQAEEEEELKKKAGDKL